MSDREQDRQADQPSSQRAAQSIGSAPVDAASQDVAIPPTAAGSVSAASGDRGTSSRQDESGWASVIGDTDRFASEWERIETEFVDDPKGAVEKADRLVGEVTRALTDSFSDTRARLEEQWGKGAEASTEDLRLTLQRYRAFFNRLLPR